MQLAFVRSENKAGLYVTCAMTALLMSVNFSRAAECGALAENTFRASDNHGGDASRRRRACWAYPPTPQAVNAPFCRVEGVIRPSADSDISFEVWLPPAGAWNGKFSEIGNGGFAGS